MQTAPPVPEDCVVPHLEGRRSGANRCRCDHHRWLNAQYQRAYMRKRRAERGPACRRGHKWEIGHNALDATPLLEACQRAGFATHAGDHERLAVQPRPDLARILRRSHERGRDYAGVPCIPLHDADKVCVYLLGVHPYDVFGEAIFQLETGEPRW